MDQLLRLIPYAPHSSIVIVVSVCVWTCVASGSLPHLLLPSLLLYHVLVFVVSCPVGLMYPYESSITNLFSEYYSKLLVYICVYILIHICIVGTSYITIVLTYNTISVNILVSRFWLICHVRCDAMYYYDVFVYMCLYNHTLRRSDLYHELYVYAYYHLYLWDPRILMM